MRGNSGGHTANDTFTLPPLDTGSDPVLQLQQLLQRLTMVSYALQRLLRNCWASGPDVSTTTTHNSATGGGPVTVVPVAALLGVACRALETDVDALRMQAGRYGRGADTNAASLRGNDRHGESTDGEVTSHGNTSSLLWHRLLKPALAAVFTTALSLTCAVVDAAQSHIVRHVATVVRVVETVLARPSSSTALRAQAYNILVLYPCCVHVGVGLCVRYTLAHSKHTKNIVIYGCK